MGRQFGKTPCPGTIRKLVVDPQVLQHLDQVAFTRAEEPTHPDAWLLRFVEIREVGGQDSLQPVSILTITHEIADLVPQRINLWVGLPSGHLRHTVIEQFVRLGIFLVELSVQHQRRRLEVTRSVIRIGWAAKPIGEGVCQVDGLPVMSRLVGRLLK